MEHPLQQGFIKSKKYRFVHIKYRFVTIKYRFVNIKQFSLLTYWRKISPSHLYRQDFGAKFLFLLLIMRFWYWNFLSRLEYRENYIFGLLIFHILFSVPHLVKTIYFCMIPLFCFAWICSRELLSPFDHFHFHTNFQLVSDFILTVCHIKIAERKIYVFKCLNVPF